MRFFCVFLFLFSFSLSSSFCGLKNGHYIGDDEFSELGFVMKVRCNEIFEGYARQFERRVGWNSFPCYWTHTVKVIEDKGPSELCPEDWTGDVDILYFRFCFRFNEEYSPMFSVYKETNQSGEQKWVFLPIGETYFSPHVQLEILNHLGEILPKFTEEEVEFR